MAAQALDRRRTADARRILAYGTVALFVIAAFAGVRYFSRTIGTTPPVETAAVTHP